MGVNFLFLGVQCGRAGLRKGQEQEPATGLRKLHKDELLCTF